MKCLMNLLVLLLLPLMAQAQFTFSDTLDASAEWNTMNWWDTTWTERGLVDIAGDSAGYNDSRYEVSDQTLQFQISARVTEGRIDTFMVEVLTKVDWVDGVGYDSLWAPVDVMNLTTATTDSVMIVKYGPVASTQGASYRWGNFLVYHAFMGTKPWRIRRMSGVGHPLIPDASATHEAIFDFLRRSRY